MKNTTIFFVLVIVLMTSVHGYAVQHTYTDHQGSYWLLPNAQSMESVAYLENDTGSSWGYLDYTVNGAYGGVRNKFTSPDYWNRSVYGHYVYADWTGPYSNNTLYAVAYMRDDSGSYLHVIPPRFMPSVPGGNIWFWVEGDWQRPGIDRTFWGVSTGQYNSPYGVNGIWFQKNYAEEMTLGDGSDPNSHNPMYSQIIYWDACDFDCLEYSACQINDTIHCSSVSDGNSTGYCPTSYNADGQEWVSSCDYCTPRWDCTAYNPTDCSDPETVVQNCTAVQDLDNCYAQTGLGSDNYTGDYSEFQRTCYQGGSPPAEAPKEEPIPPQPEPEPLPEPLVPIEVITCNPGVEYVYTAQQKVITTFRDIEVPYVVREAVGETTCGIDADGDGNKCDLNEDFVSCKSDCKIQFTEVVCLDPYRCMLTESWFLQIVLLLELLVSTYLLYTIFMG